MQPSDSNPTRREFLQDTALIAVSAAIAVPHVVGAGEKSGTKNARVGKDSHQYECLHGWGKLPKHVRWGETHGVAVDSAGLIYVKHRSTERDPIDSIVIFDAQGEFVRSFGKEYHGGGHGIDIRREGNEEFLYLSDVRHNIVAKTTLKGEVVWRKGTPQEPGVYKPGMPYVPTNVAFAPDGGFYIGDGYGSHFIHQYDKDAKWVRSWGGAGTENGKMRTPHGLWLDNRPGREPALVVADRANARLQYFSLDGKFLSIVSDVSFPAHFDTRGTELLVPDLHARVSIFDKDNKVIVHLGHDAEWTKKVLAGFKLRGQPKEWLPGKFIHPHDACYDHAGNIFVVEWVPTGRVTLLKHLV